jgi:hypothetical protein
LPMSLARAGFAVLARGAMEMDDHLVRT